VREAPSHSARAAKAVVLLAAVLGFGTLGYMLLEGWSFLESLYMTVITITTVGYGEVRQVSWEGRVFTILVIFLGMGIIAYLVGIVAQAMVRMQLLSILERRRLGLQVKNMKNHYIVCGYGRIGRVIAQELKAHRVPFLVVEQSPGLREVLEGAGIPYIIGDATSEEVLVEAGIERAKGLVSVVLSDADNLFITMTARGLNPNLFILVRADEEHNQKKLLRAGANRVVLPYVIGGQKMAHTIVKPLISDFFELTVHDRSIELRMEELRVSDSSPLNGVTLMESGLRHRMNVLIVAIHKKDGTMTFNPSSTTRIEGGDTLIALGHQGDLDALAKILEGNSGRG